MNIVIIGTGYVGLVTGVGLANLGNTVDFIDLDENKINDLSSKKITFYEPGLEEIKPLKGCLFRQTIQVLSGKTLILSLCVFKHQIILKQILLIQSS